MDMILSWFGWVLFGPAVVFPDQLNGPPEGQVSNGSCQLADESSARRAGVVKADLERNQVIRQLAASIPTGTSTSPLMWIRWGRRVPKCVGLRFATHLKQIHAKAAVSTVTLTQHKVGGVSGLEPVTFRVEHSAATLHRDPTFFQVVTVTPYVNVNDRETGPYFAHGPTGSWIELSGSPSNRADNKTSRAICSGMKRSRAREHGSGLLKRIARERHFAAKHVQLIQDPILGYHRGSPEGVT
ncbi:hypothetical protein Bbelb_271520 [Branchiostoma belcheri]|nr:hypothetical protein Bbelb_271520 [Branchiostoma belcheri]